MTETDLQNLIRCELSRRGCFVQRTNVGTFYNIPSWAFKFDKPVFLAQWLHGNARSVKIGIPGQSDLCGHRPDGRAFYIEVKKPGQKPRKNQQDFLNAMQNSGALAGVAHSVEEAVGIVFGEPLQTQQQTIAKAVLNALETKEQKEKIEKALQECCCNFGGKQHD